MSNISLSAQIKKDHLISLYDLLPVVFFVNFKKKEFTISADLKNKAPTRIERDLPNFQ